MPMRQRADAVEAAARGRELLTLEHQPDRLGLLQRQRRQVGDGALPDALALPDAFAQQDRGLGVRLGTKSIYMPRNVADLRRCGLSPC